MRYFTPLRRAAAWPAVGLLLAWILTGCGGGGGGGSVGGVIFGRSYSFVSGAQFVVITIDSVGRFSIVSRENALAVPNGAQGSLAADGQFFAQSSDGTLQYNGSLTTNSTIATGTVQRGGSTIISFTANQVPAGPASTDPLSGTYSGSAGGNAAIMSVDVTGHATLLASVNLLTGGGIVTIATDGTFSSSDGGTTGQLTAGVGGAFTLRFDKLNGTVVNVSIPMLRSSRAKWTFMVFINAANNLEEFGPLNVNQMEQIGSTADVNIVVQWKQAICNGCGNPDWISTRRYFITKDNDTNKINSQLVQDLGSGIDMGDWRTLRTFVTWAQNRYPADHFALVIWNHGAGWRPTRAGRDRMPVFPRSVSIDDSTNSEIQIWELPQALNVTPQLDMLVFDASLMQMTEVAYEIRDSIKGPNNIPGILVGSEESPPGQGYVYNTFLGDLTANPNMSAAQLGQQIVQRTIDSYGTDTDITQSEIDLTKMQNVADKLNAFGNSLHSHLVDSRSAIVTARQTAQSYKYFDNKDLWDYARLISANTAAVDLKNAASNMQGAIQSAVIYEKHGTINGNSHGLAIYVPPPGTSTLSAYPTLALGRTTSWLQFLQDQPLN